MGESDSLKDQVTKLKKELQKARTEGEKVAKKFQALTADFEELTVKYNTSQRIRVTAENEVTGLRQDIDDLSSELFNQANEMVSTARRSENDYKVKNRQLTNEIEEKDMMIETYKQQLNQLKEILQNLEEEKSSSKHSNLRNASTDHVNRSNNDDTVDNGSQNVGNNQDKSINESREGNILLDLLYSPPIQAIRYDLLNFQNFLILANKQQSSDDHDSMKETKFYKRILHDDIQPTLKLDSAPGVSFLQKRSLMSAIFNGRVIIEPIASVNESFKKYGANSISNSIPGSARPVATAEACAICGESRDSSLEYARLYMLKMYSSTNTNTSSSNNTSSNNNNVNNTSGSNENEEVTHSFPLCTYCVFRIRSTCELYAFLRSLKQKGVWKMSNLVDQKKAYVECLRLRLKMFWSRQGMWDNYDTIVDNHKFDAHQLGFNDGDDTEIKGETVGNPTENGENDESLADSVIEYKVTTTTSSSSSKNRYSVNFGSYVEKLANSAFSTPSKAAKTASSNTTSTTVLSPISMDEGNVSMPDSSKIEQEQKEQTSIEVAAEDEPIEEVEVKNGPTDTTEVSEHSISSNVDKPKATVELEKEEFTQQEECHDIEKPVKATE